jgi:molybdopterin-containing oxidoreductase family membrane subunit
MLEKALCGSWQYWTWIAVLALLMFAGALAFLYQFNQGLQVTGLGRDVPWGLYIAQLTFMVGVAASAVMVVLPYYLHDYSEFGRLTILGELLAIAAVSTCALFVFVDLGQPMRLLNIFLYPSPSSVMFWDATVLFGYLLLNIVISRVAFGAEKKGVPPPAWLKPLILLSIPWAVSIHTVTAFLYNGLAARPFWLTAILAPRFLASAFAAGPALLILLSLLLRRHTRFDPGLVAIRKLGQIVAYAMVANVFFIGLELFTALYSGIPEHVAHLRFMYFGQDGNQQMVLWTWASVALAGVALVLLVPPWRKDTATLAIACGLTITSLWLDKGLGLVITGFIPSTFGEVVTYSPTLPEGLITLGIYAFGALLLTVLFKVAVAVRTEQDGVLA